MSQEPPPLAPRIAEDDSDDRDELEDPATELDAAGDTRRRIIDGIIQPARQQNLSCSYLYLEPELLSGSSSSHGRYIRG